MILSYGRQTRQAMTGTRHNLNTAGKGLNTKNEQLIVHTVADSVKKVATAPSVIVYDGNTSDSALVMNAKAVSVGSARINAQVPTSAIVPSRSNSITALTLIGISYQTPTAILLRIPDFKVQTAVTDRVSTGHVFLPWLVLSRTSDDAQCRHLSERAVRDTVSKGQCS